MRSGLEAWDPINQKVVWRADGGGGIGGGSVTTGGQLVFQVLNDGHFRAYSADKGEKLYDVRPGALGWLRRLRMKLMASSMSRS